MFAGHGYLCITFVNSSNLILVSISMQEITATLVNFTLEVADIFVGALTLSITVR